MTFEKGHPNYRKVVPAAATNDEIKQQVEAEVNRLFGEIIPEPPIPPPKFRYVPNNTSMPIVEDGRVKMVEKGGGFNWRQKLRLGKNPTTTYVVTILFGNATCEHYIIETQKNYFEINKRRYHLNKVLAFYDVNFHQDRLIYFEDYVEPIEPSKVHIEGDKAFLTITPDNMKEVLEMEYVTVLSKSAELTKWLKILIFLTIASLGLALINTIIFIAQSGILQNISRGVTGG